MAGIDKTYINNWETFNEIRNWALNQHFTLSNGDRIDLVDYMYYPDLTEEEWRENEAAYKKEHPDWGYEVTLWNTPTYVDIWLIRNCPFQVIQDRLKEQYGGGWSKTAFTDHPESEYDQIKNGTSVYDTYVRGGRGKDAKVKLIHTEFGKPVRDKKVVWDIDVNPGWIGKKKDSVNRPTFWYNEKDDAWYNDREAMPWSCNICTKIGAMSNKTRVNLIKKWNFPSGTIVKFTASIGRWMYYEIYYEVK